MSRPNKGDLRLELLTDAQSPTLRSHSSATGDYAQLGGITPLSRCPSSVSVHYPPGDGWVSEMNFLRADTPSQLRQRFIQIQVVDRRFKEPSWMHPNIGGEAQYVQGRAHELAAIREELEGEDVQKHKLGEWTATSISGNDILSSVLFTAGQTIAKAGKLAPIAQLFVVVVVYCLRWVFEEVMSAVPLNGGCYNGILNSASKKTASVAATFSVLSYLATGVVCGVSALNYVNESLVALPVMVCTIAMLFMFALLCLLGIAESAFVALLFFVFHTFTLVVLAVFSIVYVVQHPSIFLDNMSSALPDVTILGGLAQSSNVFTALFLGYGTALLSVTGFESSSQYVEEQASGVFPKTLRNMWALSSAFNVVYALLALAVVPLDTIIANQETLLAYMGRLSGGRGLEILVAVDAFVVLAGAVLTSYVGINGLVQRLAIDRVLPSFLLKQNSCRGSNHFIILSYFAVASSLVFILDAQVDALSGVFALAFLGVLMSFTVACLLLKMYREQIPRARSTSWLNTGFCLVTITLGFISNSLSDLTALMYFAIYFAAFFFVVLLMLERVTLLKGLLFISRKLSLYYQERRGGDAGSTQQLSTRSQGFVGSVLVAKAIERIKNTPVVFFCKAANLPKINEAVSYVIRNEHTYCLRLVHVCEPNAPVPREFEDVVGLFDHIYPSIKIDFIAVTGAFDPAMVQWLSNSMAVPTNMMFMRQHANDTIHRVSALGVRIITD
ncbi:hypothetical protein BBJ28_00015606 [Nothophytophthora sp. Chile5]|nr:hypothetical protein BBJ28_00015606 [Nothophytophthora sp. Chile5]